MAIAGVRSRSNSNPPFYPNLNSTRQSILTTTTFDPQKHLNFCVAPKTYSMKDIGLPEDIGVSSVAVSEPLPLFTPEAVQRIRTEALSDEVYDNCRFSSNIVACQLRGFAPKYAKFCYDAWKHSEILAVISQIVGIDLVTNISFRSEAQKGKEFTNLSEKNTRESENGVPKIRRKKMHPAA